MRNALSCARAAGPNRAPISGPTHTAAVAPARPRSALHLQLAEHDARIVVQDKRLKHLQQLPFLIGEVILHDRSNPIQMPIDLIRLRMVLERSVQLCYKEVDHRMVLLKLAQHRCQLGMCRLNRRKKSAIFTAMMFAECRAESMAVQQKVTADNRRQGAVVQLNSSRPQCGAQARVYSM